MNAQFTQQLLVGENLRTFLFTEKNVTETESIYIVCVLNCDDYKPFKMYYTGDHYEIMNENVHDDIRNIRFQLNQAINSYNTMQSLLSSLNTDVKEEIDKLRSSNQ
jgi:uncharacterized protein YvpB